MAEHANELKDEEGTDYFIPYAIIEICYELRIKQPWWRDNMEKITSQDDSAYIQRLFDIVKEIAMRFFSEPVLHSWL